MASLDSRDCVVVLVVWLLVILDPPLLLALTVGFLVLTATSYSAEWPPSSSSNCTSST